MAAGIRDAQNKLFQLLQFFANVCKENEIDFWLDGGTLLGAVRHGGFIPWDDDVDVCVMEKDYARLVSILRVEVNKTENYFLYNDHRPVKHLTEYLADCTLLKSNFLPVEIDIVKVKSMDPTDKLTLEKDKRIIEALKYFLRKKFNIYELRGKEELHFITDRSYSARKKMYSYFQEEYLPSLPRIGSDLEFGYCYNDLFVNRKRRFYTKAEIFPLRSIEFQGVSFSCPANYESYLTVLYGENFMEPPPPDKQKPASNKYRKNRLPRKITTFGVKILYFLKEVKNWLTLKKIN